MASTNISNKSTFLPVEIEIEIFRKMNNMRDLISYALTTKHRTNILKTHAKYILDNKKLPEDDFLTWFRVLVHFNIIIDMHKLKIDKKKEWLKVLNILYSNTKKLMKKYKKYRLEEASDINMDEMSIANDFLNKYPSEKSKRDEIATIINLLIKSPIKSLRAAILPHLKYVRSESGPIFKGLKKNLKEIPIRWAEALSLQYYIVYAMYISGKQTLRTATAAARNYLVD